MVISQSTRVNGKAFGSTTDARVTRSDASGSP
jgi:hypothetical protein